MHTFFRRMKILLKVVTNALQTLIDQHNEHRGMETRTQARTATSRLCAQYLTANVQIRDVTI